MLKWLLQKFMKTSILKFNLSIMIDQLKFRKCLTSVNKLKKYLDHSDLLILNYLKLTFWKKLFMDITQHISPMQICNWVSRHCKTPQVNSSLLSQYWTEFSPLTSIQKIITEKFSKGNDPTHYRKFSTVFSIILQLRKLLFTLKSSCDWLERIHLCLFMIPTIEVFQEILFLWKNYFLQKKTFLCLETVFSCPSNGEVHNFTWLPQSMHKVLENPKTVPSSCAALRVLLRMALAALKEHPDERDKTSNARSFTVFM